MTTLHPTRRLVSTREAREYLKVSKTKLFELVHSGRVDAVRFDGRLLVDLDSVDSFINSLPSVRG
jgi:excisionase family DNA binding protein